MDLSYAQHLEDYHLASVFADQGEGFYIDVGAHDPVVDSVSKAFYEHGWRGIHVEPLAEYADALRKDRPDERSIAVGLRGDDVRAPMIAVIATLR